MRLYTFGNMYLSSMQQSLQAAHLVANLFVKYPNELHDVHTPDQMLYDWATDHKTLICLNGGNNQEMIDLCYNRLYTLGEDLGLPFDAFHEDQQSLGGLMTCCGIVVPAKIYDTAQAIRGLSAIEALDNAELLELTATELDLALLLNQYSLAR